MAVKGQENLIPMNERSKDEVRELGQKGGIRSGEVRREKATMKATLEMLLNETYKNGKTYRELATLGLLKGAINGNAQNYKAIVEVLGELGLEQQLDTPKIQIEIVNNEDLEKSLYENNN